ncbi:hypothetical protein [Conexibacter sp. SYSU D00693]|uniref:hypothetical protein n=1 Tax=Conexibacter sp. SYSU D00693 TaxID=2812560 RepID=UPI00196ACF1C|nr:hypothetical protein [Conexibacter sp. SYSU D00693]
MTSSRLAAAALALGALAAAAPAAQADQLLAAAPGAQDLDVGGGYAVWSAPRPDGRFDLVVRAPDGTQRRPVAPFGAPVNASIGSDRFGFPRALLAVYSRCAGASTISGCDVFALDLRTDQERPVGALASRTYSETAPSVQSGIWTFVRRGGVRAERKGVWSYRQGRPTRRITSTLARETVTNGSRVAYTYSSSRGGGVAIRRLSGEGDVLTPATRLQGVPSSLDLTRYNATWLHGGKGFITTSFGGSGRDDGRSAVESRRPLPAGTVSLAVSTTVLHASVLTGEGLVALSPRIYP